MVVNGPMRGPGQEKTGTRHKRGGGDECLAPVHDPGLQLSYHRRLTGHLLTDICRETLETQDISRSLTVSGDTGSENTMRRDSGVTLLSYSTLSGESGARQIQRTQSQVNNKKLSIKSFFIRLLSSRKIWRGKFRGDHDKVSQEKRRERSFSTADVRKVVRAEREIERFQRDFVQPLETWRRSSCQELARGGQEQARGHQGVTDTPDGKGEEDRKSVVSSSCYDSGHFSETSSFLQSSESESPESLSAVSPSSSTSSSFKRKKPSIRNRARSMGNIHQRPRYGMMECLITLNRFDIYLRYLSIYLSTLALLSSYGH